jgi:hypothetical protein
MATLEQLGIRPGQEIGQIIWLPNDLRHKNASAVHEAEIVGVVDDLSRDGVRSRKLVIFPPQTYNPHADVRIEDAASGQVYKHSDYPDRFSDVNATNMNCNPTVVLSRLRDRERLVQCLPYNTRDFMPATMGQRFSLMKNVLADIAFLPDRI